MEFWGIEIKPGKPFKVEAEDGYMIHVSQVTIEVIENKNVGVYVKHGEDKSELLIATLSQKIPQTLLDIFFEQDFEIYHNSKGSVFMLGYKVPDSNDEIESDSELEDFMRERAGILHPEENKPAGDESGSDEGEESESDEGEDEDESEGEEEEEDIAPSKVEPPSKKRPNGEAMNNTVASKKAKVAVQNKSSGGKKKCASPCGSSCKN